jgi:hypothetical protein
MALHGTVMSDTARPAGVAAPLPWPAAALTIGMVSAGLWLGVGWVVAALF